MATYSSLSVILGVFKEFWRQDTYDENTRYVARVQETEMHWIATKTLEKNRFIVNFHCILDRNQKIDEKITASFLSSPTSNSF